jgi:ubiquinone/menaquinone biosynthesis C-methylase UbiE
MNPRIAADEIGKFYPEDYAPHRSKTTGLKNRFSLRNFRKQFFNGVKITPSVRRKLNKQSKFLDIGCGSGGFLNQIKNQIGCRIYGIDISETAAKAAKETYNIDIFNGPVTQAPFPANSFDVITAWWLLEHVGNPSEILRKMYSLLRDDGCCIIGVPNIDSFNARVFKDKWYHLDSPRHLCLYSPDTITKLLDKSGFVVTKMIFGKTSKSLLYSLRYHFGDDTVPLKRRKRPKGLSLLKKLLLPLTILLGLLKQSDTFAVYARKKHG